MRERASQSQPVVQEPAVARTTESPVERVLALQRGAGNAAVARALLQRDGWGEARKGGWNEKARTVAHTQRLVIKDLKAGIQEADPSGSTSEKSGEKNSGRAIVVVPENTDFSGHLEVLLVFHGLGANAGIGYRERTDSDIGGAGTVHDVEADVIPQQLSSSGRNMIAILPQGLALPPKSGDRWGITDTSAYVTDVLNKVKAELGVTADVTPYRIVSAGHSGGGPQAVESADALQKGDWALTAPLFLFDAINGPNELRILRETLTRWLEADKKHLLAAPNPADELARRGLKFRSTYNKDGVAVYIVNHKGNGDYTVRGKKVHITRDESVIGFLEKWFKDNVPEKLKGVAATWEKQYEVDERSGDHHYQIGTGAPATKRDKAPEGLTGPSKAKGVPAYDKDTGNLEKSLEGLPKDAKRPEKTAELEPEDDPSKVFA